MNTKHHKPVTEHEMQASIRWLTKLLRKEGHLRGQTLISILPFEKGVRCKAGTIVFEIIALGRRVK